MEEINLYKLLRFFTQNWLFIVILTLAGLTAGLVYNAFIQVPMYKSTATLLFVNPSGVSSTQDATRLSNYVQLFQSRRVLEPVMSEQEIGMTFDQFIGQVSATNDKNTEVIRLSISTTDPEKSREFLREAVISFKNEAKEIYGTDSLNVVDDASNAEPPYNVNRVLQLAIATSVGFVVSLIVLFFVYDASEGKAKKLLFGKKRVRTNVRGKKPVRKTRALRFTQRLTEALRKGSWIEGVYTVIDREHAAVEAEKNAALYASRAADKRTNREMNKSEKE